jgi:drug/metabolite transporter (DMT)-like permease
VQQQEARDDAILSEAFMRTSDIVRLFTLAALWGASFLGLRVVAPTLGAIVTAEARVAIAGLALLAWCAIVHVPLRWREHAWPMTVVGLFNSAIPFALFAFAVKTIPGGYAAILNATSPLFGAVIASLWLRETLGGRRLLGIVFGVAGVACVVKLGPVAMTGDALIAYIACLAAACCYGFAGNYTKQLGRPVAPTAMATGSQITAAIALLPLIPFDPVQAVPTHAVIAITAALGIGSTAIAYLFYFRLIRDVGATRALTVTFLVPLFAVVWGWALLDEAVTWRMAGGGALVLIATWLVVSASNAKTVAAAVASPGAKPVAGLR